MVIQRKREGVISVLRGGYMVSIITLVLGFLSILVSVLMGYNYKQLAKKIMLVGIILILLAIIYFILFIM